MSKKTHRNGVLIVLLLCAVWSAAQTPGTWTATGSMTTQRGVQTATLLVLEPIFEADFLDSSYGFRPGKNAHQAIDAIGQQLAAGLTAVYDADLKSYFDTIPHDRLLRCLEHRISDRSVLKLNQQTKDRGHRGDLRESSSAQFGMPLSLTAGPEPTDSQISASG